MSELQVKNDKFICPKCHKESYKYNYSWEFVTNKDLQGHIGNLETDYEKRQMIVCPYCYTETPLLENEE